jgi:diguanylate cyclase (GGDEF)-like protein/PAS domain S-box-containing protein
VTDPLDTLHPVPDDAGDEFCGALDLLHHLSFEEQSAVLRTVVDALPDAIIVHRFDGRMLFFSRGACEMLGYNQEEMIALGPLGWVAPEAAEGARERLETILEDGALDFESVARCSNGTTIPTDVSARRVQTQDGPVVVAVIRDVTERKKAEERLVFLAFHDALTGLSNRAALDERLRVAMAESKRHNDLLGVAYIDLDRFKPVNDAHGHEVGDRVLVAIAARLLSCIRQQDLVSRIGGDEFVVVLPRLKSKAELTSVAKRLLGEICKPIEEGGAVVEVTASIGFALFDAETDDPRGLVVKADVAMYAAKKDPQRPWRLWDESMGMEFPR